MFRKLGFLLVRVAFAYLLIQMLINAFRAGGWDFPVYHRTARHLLHGEPIYDLARDQNDSFKYPPWIAPFFLPLSPFPLAVAAPLWQLLQCASAWSIFQWCRKHTRHTLTVPLSAVFFYGIFHVNILAGQIQLPLLAIALHGYARIQRHPTSGFFALFFSLSTKVFNLLSLIGLPRGSLRPGAILKIGIFAFLLSLPALSGFQGGSPLLALRAYVEVATSKTGNLRGAHQGFPAFFEWVTQSLHIPMREWQAFGASVITAFWIFRTLRRRIAVQSQVFAMALAFGAAIHPLAFSYSFTWTYPLGAFAVEHAFLSAPKSLRLRGMAALGLFFLLILPSAFIADQGYSMPTFGPRAIGVFLLAWVLASERDDQPLREKNSESIFLR